MANLEVAFLACVHYKKQNALPKIVNQISAELKENLKTE